MHITDAQLATYKEQGFLIVENFLTKDEQQAALDGFFTHFAPPYDQYLANDRRNDTPPANTLPLGPLRPQSRHRSSRSD